MSNYTTTDSCRICGNKDLKTVFELGDYALCGRFPSRDEPDPPKTPMTLLRCDDETNPEVCGLLQLKEEVQGDELYQHNYGYLSGVNSGMKRHLNDIVDEIVSRGILSPGDVILDIGSNDCTSLKMYNPQFQRIGIDPTGNQFIAHYPGDIKLLPDYFTADNFRSISPKKAKVISSIAMFYDLPNPVQFAKDIGSCLDPKGIWVFEQSYMPLMLGTKSVDTVCFKPGTLILGENKNIEDLKKGDKVIGSNGEFIKILKTMCRKFNGKMININPKYFDNIIATPEHPIQIVRKEAFKHLCGQLKSKIPIKYNLEWIKASDIKKDDYIVIPKIKPKNDIKELDLKQFNKLNSPYYRRGLLSIPLNEKMAWIMGLYTAEGNTGGSKDNPYIQFTLNIKEQDYLQKIKDFAKSLGYAEPNVRTYADKNSMEICLSSTALSLAFTEWFGKGSINKKIPDFIMFAKDSIKTAYLRGLFEGDGYIKKNKVHFHTISKLLALQSQLLVASMNGLLGISWAAPSTSILNGRQINSKESWQLRGSSKELAKIFGYEHIGVKFNHAVIEKDYILVPIKKIQTEDYNGNVYNIETENNTYLVSNAIVHNCGEHLEYYHLKPIQHLLEKADMKIIDVNFNDTNGGSFRVTATHKNNNTPSKVDIESLLQQERLLGLNTSVPYQEFKRNSEQVRSQIKSFLKKEKAKGKSIYILGASTKGNTLLQYCGIDNTIMAVAMYRNRDKIGRRTPGTNIPIISEEEGRKANPDMFFVLPWHFKKELIEREKEYLMNGGRLVFPLPKFEVVTKDYFK